MVTPVFKQLNHGWNAEPNSPSATVTQQGSDVLLRFYLNAFRFPAFQDGDEGILRFAAVSRFRLGSTNEEGWYKDQCRYSKLAPHWGEFYELMGDDPIRNAPNDWTMLSAPSVDERHFLFYLRDNTFEVMAKEWAFAQLPNNALLQLGGNERIT